MTVCLCVGEEAGSSEGCCIKGWDIQAAGERAPQKAVCGPGQCDRTLDTGAHGGTTEILQTQWLSFLCSVCVYYSLTECVCLFACVFSGDYTLLCGCKCHSGRSDESVEAVWGDDHQLQAQHRQAGGRSPVYPGVTHIRQQTHQVHHGGASLCYMLYCPKCVNGWKWWL